MANVQVAQGRIYPAINTGSDNTLAGKMDAVVAEVSRGYALKAAAYTADGVATTAVLPEPARAVVGVTVYLANATLDAIANQVSGTLGADAKTVTLGAAPTAGKRIVVTYVN